MYLKTVSVEVFADVARSWLQKLLFQMFCEQDHMRAACNVCLVLQVMSSILPCVRELSTDASQYVRSALAGVVMELAPMLGKASELECSAISMM